MIRILERDSPLGERNCGLARPAQAGNHKNKRDRPGTFRRALVMTPISITAPAESITVEAKLLPDQAACATVVQSPPSAEQVAAAEAVFSQHKDADLAYGLLGIWTSTVLLHDLALEHFWT